MGFIGLFLGIWFYMRTVRKTLKSCDTELVPVMKGFWTRKIISNCEYDDSSDEMKITGTIGLIIGMIIFIAAILNI